MTGVTTTSNAGQTDGPVIVTMTLVSHGRHGITVPADEIARRVRAALHGAGYSRDLIDVKVEIRDDVHATLVVTVWPEVPANAGTVGLRVHSIVSQKGGTSEVVMLISAQSVLRFTIHRDPENDPRFANWIVTGNRPDWADDLTWGHFTTWREALAFANARLHDEAHPTT